MPIQYEGEPLNNTLVNHIQITNDNAFIMPVDEEITTGDLLNIVEYYQKNFIPGLLRNKRYYEGHHDILNKHKLEDYKPDNRVVINFPKKAINDFNGFFISNPVAVRHPNEDKINDLINTWCNSVNFDKVNLQVSKQSSEFGVSFYYLYQDEEGKTCVTSSSPLDTFIIYDDTPAMRPKYAIQFSKNYNNQFVITLTDENVCRTFIDSKDSEDYLTQTQAFMNPYPIIPVIEMAENDERLSMCNDIYTIFDAIDKAMSEKANDVDYFADAYLKMVNVHIKGKDKKEKQKELRNIQSNRVINADGSGDSKPDIGFLEKPDADNTQEHLIDRLINSFYEIAGLTNINDEAFAGNPSGVSLQIKFSAMKNMATTKSINMQSSLRRVFECLFYMNEDIDNEAWQQLNFKFKQNLPRNLNEIGNFINYAYGKISQKLLLNTIGITDDIDSEIQEEKQEKKENMQLTNDITQQFTNDSGDE